MLVRTRRVLPSLITALALTVGMVVGVIAPTLGLGFAPVLSPSMRPALTEGDLLVVRTVDTTRLTVGHIVLLADGARADTEGSDVVAHRIVALDRDDAGTHVHTQGDANPARDAGPRTIVTPTAGVVVASIPLVGDVALALASLPTRLTIGAVVFIALVLATRRTMLTRHPLEDTRSKEEDPMRRRPRPDGWRSAPLLAAAAVLALVATAGPSAPPATATVEATARTLLDAALDHLGIADASPGAIGALESLVADAIRTGVLDHGVLTVVAGQDPMSVPLFVCAHARRERERWADVGPVWTRAYGALGLTPGGCDPSDDTPCGLVLRLRLITDAGRELAAREDCDLDCAHRLGRLRDRLVVTAREVARLDLEELGAGVDTAEDTAQLIDEADATILALSERIRIAEERAPVPDPGFDPDEECEPKPRPTP